MGTLEGRAVRASIARADGSGRLRPQEGGRNLRGACGRRTGRPRPGRAPEARGVRTEHAPRAAAAIAALGGAPYGDGRLGGSFGGGQRSRGPRDGPVGDRAPRAIRAWHGRLVLREAQLEASRNMPEIRRTARDLVGALVVVLALLTGFVFVNVAAFRALARPSPRGSRHSCSRPRGSAPAACFCSASSDAPDDGGCGASSPRSRRTGWTISSTPATRLPGQYASRSTSSDRR